MRYTKARVTITLLAPGSPERVQKHHHFSITVELAQLVIAFLRKRA